LDEEAEMNKLRKKYMLTGPEFKEFKNLRPEPGLAWAFWGKVANARGLDYCSIVSNGETFTALAKNSGADFCYPLKLKCKRRPVYVEKIPVEGLNQREIV
jgi:hypothetical protein